MKNLRIITLTILAFVLLIPVVLAKGEPDRTRSNSGEKDNARNPVKAIEELQKAVDDLKLIVAQQQKQIDELSGPKEIAATLSFYVYKRVLDNPENPQGSWHKETYTNAKVFLSDSLGNIYSGILNSEGRVKIPVPSGIYYYSKLLLNPDGTTRPFNGYNWAGPIQVSDELDYGGSFEFNYEIELMQYER